MKIKIAAIGRTQYLYKSILELQKNGFEIVLIITCKEAPEYKKGVQDFKLLAQKIGCNFLVTSKINTPEIKLLIENLQPDIAISVNWKTIIGEKIINSFPFGIINAHLGDFPRYRGNATPNWAIISNEKKVFTILHLMTKELDAGPIILKKRIPITKMTYIGDVYQSFEKNLPKMFGEAIKGLLMGTIKPKKQPKNPKLSLRCYPRIPQDGEIDWKKSAQDISKLVRASAEPFSGAYTFLDGKKLIIWRGYSENPKFPILGTPGQVAERRENVGEAVIITGKNFFVMEEVEMDNLGRKKATDIIKSIRDRLGLDTAKEIEKLKKMMVHKTPPKNKL